MKNLRDFKYPAGNPSLLAADKNNIENEIHFAEDSGARFIHIDVMDGKFVPNISLGLDFVKKYSNCHSMVNDVHLMIEKPWETVKEYALSGADIVTFHFEACPDKEKVDETIKNISDAGANVGISIKPNTPTSVLKPYLTKVNLVLLMSVEPGQGGQPFLAQSIERLDELADLLSVIDPNKRPIIEIDGGINENNVSLVRSHGAELLVAGSYLYGHEDFHSRLMKMETDE